MSESEMINDGNPVNSMRHISDTHCIKNKPSGGKKNWLKDVIIQEYCTMEDKYDKNNYVPALVENKLLQNVIQDIGSPTTQCNVSVSCFFFLLDELGVSN